MPPSFEDGRIVERGPTAQIFETPQHPYTQRLLAANLDPDPDVQAGRRAVIAAQHA